MRKDWKEALHKALQCVITDKYLAQTSKIDISKSLYEILDMLDSPIEESSE